MTADPIVTVVDAPLNMFNLFHLLIIWLRAEEAV
jgi:hypothetical protein